MLLKRVSWYRKTKKLNVSVNCLRAITLSLFICVLQEENDTFMFPIFGQKKKVSLSDFCGEENLVVNNKKFRVLLSRYCQLIVAP